MLEIIKRFAKNKYFLLGFLFPPSIVFIVNLGLIFNISNQCKLLINFTNYLSIQIPNTFTITLFVALVTIFVLFFTFAQFSFSRNNTPLGIIRKYIIEDDNTFLFLGTQLAFALILAIYSAFLTNVHMLNALLSYLFVLLSVLYSLIYFFWLIKNITPTGILNIIIKKLNFDEINQIEKEAYNNHITFQNKLTQLEESKIGYKVTTKDLLNFTLKEQIPITTTRRGFIKVIDIDKINDILSEYSTLINKIILDVKIGDYVPLYEPLPDSTPQSVLFRIERKIATSPELESKLSDFTNKLKDEKLLKKIETCIIVGDAENSYQNNSIVIEDLLNFFLSAISTDNSEAEDIVKHISAFIKKQIEQESDNEWFKEIGISEKLFLKFIELLDKRVHLTDVNSLNISSIYTFIYSFRNLATKHKSIKLMSALHNLLITVFYKILTDSNKYNSRLSIIVLQIQEISFSSLVYGFKPPDAKTFCKNWKSFYYPLIILTIDKSIYVLKLIVRFLHKRNEEDNLYNLVSNSQKLVNLLSPLNYWQPFEDISFNDNSCYNKYRKDIIYYQAKNIIYLAALIFKEVTDNGKPTWLLNEIALPLCRHCNTIAKWDIKISDIITEFFFDYDFYEPFSTGFTEDFEINKIHEASTYSPVLYNFNPFWFSLLFYLHKIDNKYHIMKTIENDFEKSRVSTFIDFIEKADIEYYARFLNTEIEMISKFVNDLKTHLSKMIE